MNSESFAKYLREHRIPIRAMLQLTYRCNFRCLHCYETPLKNSTERNPTVEEWIRILQVLRKNGCMFLSFTGGEILSVSSFSEIYESAYDMGFKISLVTNGSLISPEIINLLSNKKPEKVHITLYGMSESTYMTFCGNKNALHKVLDNIRFLRKAEINTIVMYLTNTVNWRELVDAYSFALANGCKFYQFYRFRACTNGDCAPQSFQLNPETLVSIQPEKEYEILKSKTLSNMQQWKEGYKRCNAGLTSLMIDPNGKAFLCDSVPGKRYDLLHYDFSVVWEKLYTQRKRYIEVPSACSRCENRELCGICAPTLLTEYGDPNKVPTRECVYAAALRKEFGG